MAPLLPHAPHLLAVPGPEVQVQGLLEHGQEESIQAPDPAVDATAPCKATLELAPMELPSAASPPAPTHLVISRWAVFLAVWPAHLVATLRPERLYLELG